MIISRDAQVLQEIELVRGRMTIGRHPHNDIVIAHQAVSGRHAAITCDGDGVTLEDLGSSNGTFVNGQRVAQARLADRDRMTIAAFQIDYLAGAMLPPAPAEPGIEGSIEVMNGPNAGKILSLVKPLTTLGSPGVLVVVISRQADGYFIARVQGDGLALVNRQAVTAVARLLRDGDALEVTGTSMRFSSSYR